MISRSSSHFATKLSSRPERSEVEGPAVDSCSIKYKWKRPPSLIPSGHGPGVPTQGDEKHLLFSNHSSCKRRPSLCHPEQLTCLWQVEREMTPAIATDARPGGPIAKLCSPEGLGNQSRRGSERRRCGTVSLGAQPRACPERSRRGSAVLSTSIESQRKCHPTLC
jgi:hypothetical protein